MAILWAPGPICPNYICTKFQNCAWVKPFDSVYNVVETGTWHCQGYLAGTNLVKVSRRPMSKLCKSKFGDEKGMATPEIFMRFLCAHVTRKSFEIFVIQKQLKCFRDGLSRLIFESFGWGLWPTPSLPQSTPQKLLSLWDFEIAAYSPLVWMALFFLDFIEAVLCAASILGPMTPNIRLLAKIWQTV